MQEDRCVCVCVCVCVESCRISIFNNVSNKDEWLKQTNNSLTRYPWWTTFVSAIIKATPPLSITQATIISLIEGQMMWSLSAYAFGRNGGTCWWWRKEETPKVELPTPMLVVSYSPPLQAKGSNSRWPAIIATSYSSRYLLTLSRK